MKRKRIWIVAALILIGIILIPQSAFAGTVQVGSRNSSSYFEAYETNGWTDLTTPQHYIVGTNPEQVAYCIQHRKTSPSSSGTNYSDADVLDSYTETTKWGLMIILENGYPHVTPSGLNAAEARYATANAIRFWLSEREYYEGGRDDFYNFTDLHAYTNDQLRSLAASGTIGSKVRANSRPADNDVLQFAVELLIMARNQVVVPHTLSFNPSNINFTVSNGYFIGTTTVSLTNCTGGYNLNTSVLPSGSWVSGYTGNNGDALTIYIPLSLVNAGRSITLTAAGYDDRTRNNIFAYSPSNTAYQRVVTLTIGQSYMNQAAGSNLTVNTPTVPDLTITSLTTDKGSYDAGETITATATISNIGNGAVTSFEVRLTPDGLPAQTKTAGYIGPGQSVNVIFSFTAPSYNSTTNMTLSSIVDPNSLITELDKSNNSRSTTITINAGLPDLTITSLSTDKGIYESGETVNATAVVANIGKRNVTSCDVQLVADGLTPITKTTGPINSGSNSTVSFSFTTPTSLSPQNIMLTAKADPNNRIAESDESNNSRSITIVINALRPDISIIDANTTDWYAGKEVLVSAIVKDLTAQPVPSVRIRLKVGDVTVDEKISVPGNGSNLAVFRFRVPYPTDDQESMQLPITISADPDNEIAETNESNNTWKKTQTVFIVSPSLVLDPDSQLMEQDHLARNKAIPQLPQISPSINHTWQEVRLENGNYIIKDYWARLDTVFQINPDPRIDYPDKPYLMESGFGVEATCQTTLTTNYDHPEKLIGPQMVWVFYPESAYGQGQWQNVDDALEAYSGSPGEKSVQWHYTINSYSATNSRLHYVPLWFPDGQYAALAQAFYAWSPAGQMVDYKTADVDISGDMYDRITVVRR